MNSKHLIIILCDSAPSFCHYSNYGRPRRLISPADMRKAIVFSMKHDMELQIVYPDYTLDNEYLSILDNVSHVKITPASLELIESVVCFNSADSFFNNKDYPWVSLLRLPLNEFITNHLKIAEAAARHKRLNIVFTDIDDVTPEVIPAYQKALYSFSQTVISNSNGPEINILTDRIYLSRMKNCEAGIKSLTVAPDGAFYICPGFYYDNLPSVGDLQSGPVIPNRRLYSLDNSPICRSCDAYHCHRCVWLNLKQTHEVNTPGKEQCLISHIERNASRNLLSTLQQTGRANNALLIDEIDYLDPFDKIYK